MINSHFALSDLQYTLNSTLAFTQGGCVIARDDKSKVHTDVEPVQRPSKSWVRINYADHDWDKDARRTLTITTYQFVNLTSSTREQTALAAVGGVPFFKTRVSGPGESIVKISFLEHSTIWRHMNELFFIMSQEMNKKHFMWEDEFINQLTLTVDGGGDERPRNKKPKYAQRLFDGFLTLIW